MRISELTVTEDGVETAYAGKHQEALGSLGAFLEKILHEICFVDRQFVKVPGTNDVIDTKLVTSVAITGIY